MTDLPDDAIRVVLAAVVPCPDCNATGFRYTDPDGGKWLCSTCFGDGTRAVVTDVEVECGEVFCNDEMEFVTDRAVTLPNGAEVWREVPRG